MTAGLWNSIQSYCGVTARSETTRMSAEQVGSAIEADRSRRLRLSRSGSWKWCAPKRQQQLGRVTVDGH